MKAVIVTLQQILKTLPNFAIVFVLLLVGKVLYDKTTKYRFDEELTEKDNPAFGVCLGGYLIGLGIALSGALFGSGADLARDALSVLIWGVACVLLLRISVQINDWFTLYRFSTDKEMIEDRNVGTGFVVAGSCVATGLMINGALNGESDTWATALRDMVIYWAIGQVLLVVGGVVWQQITRYDVHATIEKEDNAAAGITFGGFLVALGVVVRGALVGATSRLADEVPTTLAMGAVGLIVLSLARVIADKAFLPKSPLSKEVAVDRNPAAGVIAAACLISVAVLLASAVNPPGAAELDEPPAEQVSIAAR